MFVSNTTFSEILYPLESTTPNVNMKVKIEVTD